MSVPSPTQSADVAEPRPGEECPQCGAVVFECAACEAWVCACDGSVAPCLGCGRIACPSCGHIKGQPISEVERSFAAKLEEFTRAGGQLTISADAVRGQLKTREKTITMTRGLTTCGQPIETRIREAVDDLTDLRAGKRIADRQGFREVRIEVGRREWRLGTPQSAGRVDVVLANGLVVENVSCSEDEWATSDGTTIPRSEVAGWRPRARSANGPIAPLPSSADGDPVVEAERKEDSTAPYPLPVHDGQPLNREGALYLRERTAHRHGFRKGHKAAVGQLREAAGIAWANNFDEAARALRDTSRDLSRLEDAAVGREYGDELDGVDFAACRALLLGETEAGR